MYKVWKCLIDLKDGGLSRLGISTTGRIRIYSCAQVLVRCYEDATLEVGLREDFFFKTIYKKTLSFQGSYSFSKSALATLLSLLINSFITTFFLIQSI